MKVQILLHRLYQHIAGTKIPTLTTNHDCWNVVVAIGGYRSSPIISGGYIFSPPMVCKNACVILGSKFRSIRAKTRALH